MTIHDLFSVSMKITKIAIELFKSHQHLQRLTLTFQIKEYFGRITFQIKET